MRHRSPSGTPAVARTLSIAGIIAGIIAGTIAGTMASTIAAAVPVAAAGGHPVGGDRLGSTGVVVARSSPPLPAKLLASSWLVADATSGAVLAARNPHGRFPPASTLKILTAVTLLPRLDPRRTVEITNADETVDGSKVGLKPGLRLRIDQVFTALLVVSGNDAAKVLARAAGGEPASVRLMSAEARRLRALDTVPRTVHGLDAPGQSSSAYDLALLGRAGLAMPAFRRYVSIRRFRMPAGGGKSFEIANHNRLLGSYAGAIGIKNGHTNAAGSSLVAAARRGNRTVLVTLMHTDSTMWQQAATLLDWGFRAGAGTAPIGRLVGPVPPSSRRVAPAPATSPAAMQPQRDGSLPVGAFVLGGSLALALTAGGLLLRRRRRA